MEASTLHHEFYFKKNKKEKKHYGMAGYIQCVFVFAVEKYF
jgi:hypothetical protein